MKISLLLAVLMSLALLGCATNEPTVPARCTPAWFDEVDRRLQITPASGRGHEIGSVEWQNVVSRKTGVVDASGHGPDPGSDEWCRAVDYQVFGRR